MDADSVAVATGCGALGSACSLLSVTDGLEGRGGGVQHLRFFWG